MLCYIHACMSSKAVQVARSTWMLTECIAAVFVTIGQVKGQTLLPLPPSEITPQEPVVLQDKDKIHILESAVVTWTRQIKDVLKADSESALKVGHTQLASETFVALLTVPCSIVLL